jgi:FKBP-type peptidyl-prolyl cis-trans isomerase FkpA
MRFSIPLALLLVLAGPAAAESNGESMSEDEKVLYAIGAYMGNMVRTMELDEAEITAIERGLEDQALAREIRIDLSGYDARMKQFISDRVAANAARQHAISEKFLAEAAARPGAVRTESGMVFRESRAGTGPSPGPTDQVKVHYRGTLADGAVFDSSVERGEPAVFSVNKVIPCWTEALQRMKVGGRASITCPPEIAYGDRGAGAIKPGAALHFEVELLGIVE